MAMTHLPVTILTGFLGSGKTTLLQRLLSGDHGLRIGVILNEMGEIPIDGQLVKLPQEGLLELSNGCLCCTVREDFAKGALQMLERIDQLDYLLIETTGIADPRQVAEIFVQREFQARTRLDSIITLLDAPEYERNLERSDSAYHQIVCADVLILNKVDLVSEAETQRLVTEVRRFNRHAPCLLTTHAEVPLAQILDIHAFQPERSWDPDQPLPDLPPHGSIRSESFVLHEPLDWMAFREFLEDLPETIFRAKGLISVMDDDHPGSRMPLIFHKVGSRHSFFVDDQAKDPAGATPSLSRMVFIGHALSRFSLEARLRACVHHPTDAAEVNVLR
ncbi:MAG: GTP-binding protein [Synechococcales cyanobacterium]